MKAILSAARSLLLNTAAYGIERVARWSSRRASLVLVYHGISHREGDRRRELVPALGAQRFERQLQHLTRRYHVVPSSQLLTAMSMRKRGERFPVAITFDDDLASHIQTAMPLLRRFGLSATFFLCGATLHRPFSFWWERLQAAVDADLMHLIANAIAKTSLAESSARPDINELAATFRSMPPGERNVAADVLLAGLTGELVGEGTPERDVRKLVESGFELGFHTLRHDPLSPLDDSTLRAALTQGRSQLSEIGGEELRLIAYPHGEANDRVARAANNAGFEFGFTTVGEAVTARSDPMLLGRVTPTFRSTSHFALQLATALVGRRQR